MYGGANSHMAVRAAECSLPAAIGVGETRYAHLEAAAVHPARLRRAARSRSCGDALDTVARIAITQRVARPRRPRRATRRARPGVDAVDRGRRGRAGADPEPARRPGRRSSRDRRRAARAHRRQRPRPPPGRAEPRARARRRPNARSSTHATRERPAGTRVCRGMQMLVDFWGGAVTRIEGHVARPHELRVDVGPGRAPAVGTGELVPRLGRRARPGSRRSPSSRPRPTARVEAVAHRELRQVGIMWHPERDPADPADRALLACWSWDAPDARRRPRRRRGQPPPPAHRRSPEVPGAAGRPTAARLAARRARGGPASTT